MKIKLQEILDKKNITIYSLSKLIYVSPNNLSKIIKGETTSIKYDILEKLCNTLNITPNDMFEIESSQLNLFEIWEQYDYDKTSQVKEQIEEFADNVDVAQLENRLNLEYKLINNLFLIIDNIINNTDISEFPEVFKIDIEKYKNWVNSVEASKFAFIYRVLYVIVVKQIKNNQLLNFIRKMHDIYTSISINVDSDIELEEIVNESIYLLSIFSYDQKN